MAHRSKIIKEWVDIQVSSANEPYKASFEVDKHAKVIIGIAITANFDDLLYFRGSQRIAINDREFYPEGYESKMLMQGINVPVNQRTIDLGEEVLPGNRKVDITYQDTNHPSATFQAYRVRLYVFSRIECESDKA